MTGRFIRRNRVDEPIAVAIATGSALAATLSGASPTGSTPTDVVVIMASVFAVVWAAASAQWWASAGAAGVSAAIAVQPIVAVVGALGFFGGLHVGVRRRDLSEVRSVVAGVAVNCLIRSDLDEFFGLSALIGIGVSVGLGILGVLRRPSRIRRRSLSILGAVGGLGVLAFAGVAVAGVGARPDLTEGTRLARAAVSELNTGNYDEAAGLLDQAAERFENSDMALSGVLAVPGRLLPGVAQNLRAGRDLANSAAEAMADASGALRQADPSEVAVRDGRIDLAAIRALEAPLQRVDAAFQGLRTAVERVDSPWLIGAVAAELDDFDDEFADNEPRLANVIEAVRLAPQMLGDERLRRYLVMFTSPAEARGLGGFVGSFAVLEVDNGELSVTDFGRTSELSTPTSGADCSACDPELLQRYGRFGFSTGDAGTTGKVLFSNVTMPAHFPYVAEAVQAIYPQGRGEAIDGVIIMDPYVVQALMAYSGPIAVPELDTVVQPVDAADFLLREQYLLAGDKGVRIEALNTLGSGAIASALSGALPEPPIIARDLGPLVGERRLLMWTDDEEEQALLDRVGMLGSIPALDESDGGFSVSVTNASANKIDVFLDRQVDVEIVEGEAGRRLIAHVTLTNNAPTTGLPPYVIGNAIDEPNGTSRLFVTFYGVPELLDITQDGEVLPIEPLPEAGWMAFSSYVTLAAGDSQEFELTFALPSKSPADASAATPTLWTQPLADR